MSFSREGFARAPIITCSRRASDRSGTIIVATADPNAKFSRESGGRAEIITALDADFNQLFSGRYIILGGHHDVFSCIEYRDRKEGAERFILVPKSLMTPAI